MSEPDMEAWRAEVREWLASVLPRRSRAARRPGGLRGVPEHHGGGRARAARQGAGLPQAAVSTPGTERSRCPAELGGAGLSMRYVVAFTEEEQAFEAPQSTELISVTTGLVGPTIATFGTAEQRAKYARAFLRSDLLCCQLFSEPGAGSDLAAVATSAVRMEDERGMAARRAEGLVVGRPLRRLRPAAGPDRPGGRQAGRADHVPHPDGRARGGGPADPADERGLVVQRGLPVRRAGRRRHAGRAGRRRVEGRQRHARLRAHRQRPGAAPQGRHVRGPARGWPPGSASRGDPVVRQQLADVYVRTQLRAATTERVARAAAAGAAPGPAASIGKLVASANLMRIGERGHRPAGSPDRRRHR